MGFQGEDEVRNAAIREKILDTAHAKFLKHGVRRVTMEELARDLRMSKKTVYQYFDGKEALVRGATERIAGNLIPVVMEAMAAEGPASERLFKVFEAFSRLPRFVSTDFIRDLEADYPHIWKEIDERRQAIFGLFGQLVEQGIEEGVIRPEVHPRVVARLLRAVMDRVFVPEVLGLGEFTTDDAVRTMLTVFRRGIVRDAEDDEPGGAER